MAASPGKLNSKYVVVVSPGLSRPKQGRALITGEKFWKNPFNKNLSGNLQSLWRAGRTAANEAGGLCCSFHGVCLLIRTALLPVRQNEKYLYKSFRFFQALSWKKYFLSWLFLLSFGFPAP